jgi:hypothetical protein
MDRFIIRSWFLLFETAKAVNFLGKENINIDFNKPFGRAVLDISRELLNYT